MSSPVPFLEALAQLARRQVLPTALSSAEIAANWDAAFRRRSFFSAQTLLGELLEGYKERVLKMVGPVQVERDGRLVTEGLDLATARLESKQLLRSLGYDPGKKRGSLQDLSSDARVNLVLDTNVQLSQGAGHFIQGNEPAVLDAYPCWELIRFEERKVKRDWKQRWRLAAQISGDIDALRVLDETGRMIARKDSGIWQALGDGAGGFQDGLGNPFPPFAFKSGMWVQDVDRQTSEQLRLVNATTRLQPRTIDAGEIMNLEEAA